MDYGVRGPSALLLDPGNPNTREKTLSGQSAQLYRVIIQVGNPAPGGGEVLATPSLGCTGSHTSGEVTGVLRLDRNLPPFPGPPTTDPLLQLRWVCAQLPKQRQRLLFLC